jgi:Na+/H+ antiporter NhaD/arsenite permease-like protein
MPLLLFLVLALFPGLALASAPLSTPVTVPPAEFPAWSILPFAGLLLTLGVMSFMAANYPHSRAGQFWENNNNKLLLALLWSLPVLVLLGIRGDWQPLFHSLEEYFAFIILLLALFVISGGIYLNGDLHGNPRTNTVILTIGAVLANVIGTTGASMLLIRLLLETNSERKFTSHIPVFFIFAVSNIGGCLLPIGDPPLFLGYLRGVPFFWTLNLWLEWVVAIGLLLAVFFVFDTLQYRKESQESLQLDQKRFRLPRIQGGINVLWLIGVLLAVVFITPNQLQAWGMGEGWLKFSREYAMLLLVAASLLTSPLSSAPRQANNFTFAPILEVAYLFIGIFIAMIPALLILKAQGPSLGIVSAWQYFWAAGSLSAVLDNAPTYLTFMSLAQGVAAASPGVVIPPELQHIQGGGVPANLLVAVSLGAVFMGAMTYIGNGPNFMVKAIAEQWGYKMPDFFTYIVKYSIPILLPIFLVVTLIFLI